MGLQSQAPQAGQSYAMGSANAGSAPQASFDGYLARQSSIYSLTLQEFQNAFGEPAKKFGSMNMDELLKNIWMAEEGLVVAAGIGEVDGGLVNELPLPKQGSLTLPRTVSRKTVDEMWKGIQQGMIEITKSDRTLQQRAITFGDMTLEDFLAKAGVVKEETVLPSKPCLTFTENIGMVYQNNRKDDIPMNVNGLAGFDNRMQITENNNAGVAIAPILITSPSKISSNLSEADARKFEVLDNVSVSGQQVNWLNNVCRTTNFQKQQRKQQVIAKAICGSAGTDISLGSDRGVLTSPVLNTIGTCINDGLVNLDVRGGTEPIGLGFRTGSPHNARSDEAELGHIDFSLSPVDQYMLNGRPPGRKRGAEGNIEKAIERRQRRMIKNRESAARSRARKQAYTVELEAEVSQLKEENMRLQRKQEEESEKRKKQIISMQLRCSKQFGAQDGLLRRTHTLPW